MKEIPLVSENEIIDYGLCSADTIEGVAGLLNDNTYIAIDEDGVYWLMTRRDDQ